MPPHDIPPSYDPTASHEVGSLEAARRSPVFRYAAAVICGIGLATAGSTLLRLSEGWRQAPRQVSDKTADQPPRIASAPAPATEPLSTNTQAGSPAAGQANTGVNAADARPPDAEKLAAAPERPDGSARPSGSDPTSSAQAPSGSDPESTSMPSAQVATAPDPIPAAGSPIPGSPGQNSLQRPPPGSETPSPAEASSPAEPNSALRAVPQLTQAPAPTASSGTPPAAEPIRPVAPPAAAAPSRLAQPDRDRGSPPVSPSQTSPRDRSRPSEQGSSTPSGDNRPAPPRRHRYAAPATDRGAQQFEEITPPRGTAANVRAFSFAASRGQTTGAFGAPVQVIQVR